MALVETDNLRTRSNYAKILGKVPETIRILIKKKKLKTIKIDGKEFIDIS